MSSDPTTEQASKDFDAWCEANADEIDELDLLDRIDRYGADTKWHETWRERQ